MAELGTIDLWSPGELSELIQKHVNA
jgi:hypothetical protein